MAYTRFWWKNDCCFSWIFGNVILDGSHSVWIQECKTYGAKIYFYIQFVSYRFSPKTNSEPNSCIVAFRLCFFLFPCRCVCLHPAGYIQREKSILTASVSSCRIIDFLYMDILFREGANNRCNRKNKGNLSYEDMLVIHSEHLDKTSESRKQKNNDNNLFNLFNE